MFKKYFYISGLLLLVAPSFAINDFNSSRSNREKGTLALSTAEKMLREAGDDAYQVAKTMLDIDQKNEKYNGDYEIKVEVKVSIQRVEKNNPGLEK